MFSILFRLLRLKAFPGKLATGVLVAVYFAYIQLSSMVGLAVKYVVAARRSCFGAKWCLEAVLINCSIISHIALGRFLCYPRSSRPSCVERSWLVGFV